MTLENDKNFRVWHAPQMSMQAFCTEVSSVEEGVLFLNTLAKYDKFQCENNIEPDYGNTQGLEEWKEVDGEWKWVSWEDTRWGYQDPEQYLNFLKTIEGK